MFHGIQPRRYRDVLDCLHASVHQYPRNTHLVELGEQSHNTGILLDGTVEEFLYDENGNQVSICRLASGQIFGAELACTGWSTSPVCLRAASDCTVLRLDFSALMSQQTMSCPCRMQVTANLMQDMAQQLLFFNTKVRILAQKRLRDRLKIYLQTLTPDSKGCYHLLYSRTDFLNFPGQKSRFWIMIFSDTELQTEIKGRQGVLLMEHSAFLIACGFWGLVF